MGQLNFAQNFEIAPNQLRSISHVILTFFPHNILDSISLNTLNLLFSAAGTAKSITFSLGLYSLTGSTISIANSASSSIATSGGAQYISLTATSATQNITPGTWWWGILCSFSSSSNVSFYGGFTQDPVNAFPGAFIGGAMTTSTNALPTSIATSDLDITGSDALFVPYIIISS